MPLGVQSASKPSKEMTEFTREWDLPEDHVIIAKGTPTPRKPAYKPHDDLVEILRNCHRRFTDWRYGHLLQVCERLMSHFGIGEGEG
jgi:hypothetical protein